MSLWVCLLFTVYRLLFVIELAIFRYFVILIFRHFVISIMFN